VLTKKLFKAVTKARRWRPMMVIDIAVPRDAEPAIADLDGVYLFDIDDLDKVVQANIAERQKAAEHASKIVEDEAGQFEHWLRTQGVVPTIRALRDKFVQVADAEVQKALEQLSRKDLTRDQQRELFQRSVQLVVNKLLHQPTTVLRGSDPAQAQELATAVCELFGLSPTDSSEPVAEESTPEQSPPERPQA
jgi:glutamyl-tRNA reductase